MNPEFKISLGHIEYSKDNYQSLIENSCLPPEPLGKFIPCKWIEAEGAEMLYTQGDTAKLFLTCPKYTSGCNR